MKYTHTIFFNMCCPYALARGHDLDVDNEMKPQELYVVRLSIFSTLLMTWNKLWHGQFFLLMIIIYYLYPQTDYCCSTLFLLFLPINFIISFSMQVVKTVILTQQTPILFVLTLIIFWYKLIYSERW